MTKQPKAILFDLDNTLVDREASIRRYSEVFVRDFGRYLSFFSAKTIADRLTTADSGGHRKRDDLLKRICMWSEWQQQPDKIFLERHWIWEFPPMAVAMSGADFILKKLTQAGIRVGVVTNGSIHSQHTKIMRLHLWPHLFTILVSEAKGIRKPDQRLFHIAINELGLTADDDVWFVGDHPEIDIIGAERAGLTGVWITGFHDWPVHHPPPRLKIGSLFDIISLAKLG